MPRSSSCCKRVEKAMSQCQEKREEVCSRSMLNLKVQSAGLSTVQYLASESRMQQDCHSKGIGPLDNFLCMPT